MQTEPHMNQADNPPALTQPSVLHMWEKSKEGQLWEKCFFPLILPPLISPLLPRFTSRSNMAAWKLN